MLYQEFDFFDHYCAKEYPSTDKLSQEMVDK